MNLTQRLATLAVVTATVSSIKAADGPTAADMVTSINAAIGGAPAGNLQDPAPTSATQDPGITPISGIPAPAATDAALTPLPTLTNMQNPYVPQTPVAGANPLPPDNGVSPIPGLPSPAAPPVQTPVTTGTTPLPFATAPVSISPAQVSAAPGTTPVLPPTPATTPILPAQSDQAVAPAGSGVEEPVTRLVADDGTIYTPPAGTVFPAELEGRWLYVTSDVNKLKEIINGARPGTVGEDATVQGQAEQPIDLIPPAGDMRPEDYAYPMIYQQDEAQEAFGPQRYGNRQTPQRAPQRQSHPIADQHGNWDYDQQQPEGTRQFNGRRSSEYNGSAGYVGRQQGDQGAYRNNSGRPQYNQGYGGAYDDRQGAEGYRYGRGTPAAGHDSAGQGQLPPGVAGGRKPIALQCYVISDGTDGRNGAAPDGRGTMTLRCYIP
jgi:hypothetical protein